MSNIEHKLRGKINNLQLEKSLLKKRAYRVETDLNNKVNTRKATEDKLYITNANKRLIEIDEELEKYNRVLNNHVTPTKNKMTITHSPKGAKSDDDKSKNDADSGATGLQPNIAQQNTTDIKNDTEKIPTGTVPKSNVSDQGQNLNNLTEKEITKKKTK